MRAFTKLLLVGGGLGAFLVARRRDLARRAPPIDPTAPDPRDPVQQLDEVQQFHDEELGIDAVDAAEAEVARDLDLQATPHVALDPDPVPPSASPVEPGETEAEIARARRGSGDLYGLHTPDAADRELRDDDQTFEEGENWLEALEATSTENGPEPEEELDVVDEDDVEHPPTDTRDIPVADRGAAGPRGL
jgi:hypothetical protein